MSFRNAFLFAGMALSSAFAYIIPVVGTGKFDVAVRTASLMDSERVDPFANDGRLRSIMISAFSPIPDCQQKKTQSYMSPATAAFQDEKFAAYSLPQGTFPSLELETCVHGAGRRRGSSQSFPLVLFSGALGTSRMLYNSMLQSIAAAGFLVVSIDHPYDADIVEFPDGTTITGLDLDTDADIELALTTRADDVAFLYKQSANTSIISELFPKYGLADCKRKTAVIGHSLGGATAAAALLQLPAIRGGLNLDGSMFGPVLETGLDCPFMLIGHENKTQATDPSWKTIWPKLTGWKREVEVEGAAHYSFSDLPLLTAVLGLQESLPAEVGEVLGTVEGHRMMNLTVTYVTGFLDMVLKSGSEDFLGDIDGDFSEVIEVA